MNRPAPPSPEQPPTEQPPTEQRRAAEHLGQAMRQLHRHLSSRVMSGMQEDLLGHDLSFSQVAALHHLRAHAPLSVTQLSAAIGLSLPAASHLVERLVRRGLVGRQENPANRREKHLALTGEGQALVARLDASFIEAYLLTFAPLRPDTLQRASDSLHALLAELEATASPPPTPPQESP